MCYAGDQWYLHRQQDSEGRFFWKVMDQGHRRSAPRDETRQGVYACTSDGQYLASRGFHPDPQRTLEMLQSALHAFARGPKTASLPASSDPGDGQFTRKLPDGGVALNVFTRIPLPRAEGTWTPNHATGRDHMWITREEWKSLVPQSWTKGAAVAIPAALQKRLIRFHLVDDVRGEPNMWSSSEILSQDLKLTVEDPATHRMRLAGSARMKTESGSRGYDARLQGTLTYSPAEGRFTRVDMLSWGEAWGEGTYTRGAPPGRFPLVIAFSLAGNTGADQVPPQASRWLPGYLNPD